MNHPPSFDLQCQDKQLRRAAIWDIILEVPTGMPVKSLRNEILMAGCSDEVLLSNSSADILDERRPWNNKILVLPTVPKICLKIWGPKKIGHCLSHQNGPCAWRFGSKKFEVRKPLWECHLGHLPESTLKASGISGSQFAWYPKPLWPFGLQSACIKPSVT